MIPIQQDSLGPFVCAFGWIIRPAITTRFKLGQKIKVHHFDGTSIAGVGQDKRCKRGRYLEYWILHCLSWELKEKEDSQGWTKNEIV